MARSTNKGVQTRQRILDAAVEVMAAQNPGELTIADIAQRADMSKGSVYYYFKDVDEIAREIVRDELDLVVSRFERAAVAATSAHDALVRIIDAFSDLLRENTALLRFAFGQGHTTPALALGQDVDTLWERIHTLIATQVERGKIENRVREGVDPDIASAAIVGMFLAVAAGRLFAPDPFVDSDALSGVLLDFVLHGIGA